jgi:hypothetical protein
MLEREVEAAVVTYAEVNLGLLSMKLSGPHNRGKPDRLFLYKNRACFIEMKAPGEGPTKLQEKWLKDLTANGFWAVYVDTIGKGKTQLDSFVAKVDAEATALDSGDLYDDL